MKLSKSAIRTIRKYGFDVCLSAYAENRQGYGARTISYSKAFNDSTRAADAAINAGRELVEGSRA